MLNLVPADAPHPLYGDAALRDDFLRDAFVDTKVDLTISQVDSAAGSSVSNNNGKPLTLKRNREGALSVNGVPVSQTQELSDGTQVLVVEGLLFDWRQRVNQAFSDLQITDPDAFHPWFEVPVGPPAPPGSEQRAAGAPLPALPKALEDELFELSSGLSNLWAHDTRELPPGPRSGDSRPRTLVAPSGSAMLNLVPADAPHPLYGDAALRDDFLRDAFVDTKVDLTISQVDSAAGSSVSNNNGKPLTLKRNREGALSVNGVPVSQTQELSDGTQVLVVEGLLFDWRQRVQRAFSDLQTNEPEAFRPWFDNPTGKLSIPVPALTKAQENELLEAGSGVTDLWAHASRDLLPGPREAAPRPRTLVTPSEGAMMNLVPQDAPHPLYGDAALRDAFLRDAFVAEEIDLDDPAVNSTEGLSVQNFNGKTLTVIRESEGLRVNGVAVSAAARLADGALLLLLDDLLFGWRGAVQRAFRDLQENEPEAFRPWFEQGPEPPLPPSEFIPEGPPSPPVTLGALPPAAPPSAPGASPPALPAPSGRPAPPPPRGNIVYFPNK